jgi:hypothetical protein
LIQRLAKISLKITEGKDERLNEAAVKALGLLALGEPNQPYFDEV